MPISSLNILNMPQLTLRFASGLAGNCLYSTALQYLVSGYWREACWLGGGGVVLSGLSGVKDTLAALPYALILDAGINASHGRYLTAVGELAATWTAAAVEHQYYGKKRLGNHSASDIIADVYKAALDAGHRQAKGEPSPPPLTDEEVKAARPGSISEALGLIAVYATYRAGHRIGRRRVATAQPS